MALIVCDGCGGEVSDAATACPRCGTPRRRGAGSAPADLPTNAAVRRSAWPAFAMGGGVIAAAVIVGLVLMRHSASVDDVFAESQVKAAKIQLDTIKMGLDSYYLRNQEYPETLQALVEGGQLDDRRLVDPWRTPVVYRLTGPRTYTLCSGGRDAATGSEDDICVERAPNGR